MSLNKKNKYKSYGDDYGKTSNMKLIYILVALTGVTIALIVLMAMFLGGGFDGDDSKSPGRQTNNTSGTQTDPLTGEDTTPPEGTTDNNASAEPTPPNNVGDWTVFDVTVGEAFNSVNNIPEGAAPNFRVENGSVIIDNSLKNRGDLILVTRDEDLKLDSSFRLSNEVNVYNESRRPGGYILSTGNDVSKINLEKRALSALEEFFKGIIAQNEEYKKYISVGKGYSQGADNENDAPDYQTGLSVDIYASYLPDEQGKTYDQRSHGGWIVNNAYLYGFVQRYTADKKAITGQDNDFTNYRYVGFPHSYVMKSKNWCLDEYVEQVRKEKQIKVMKNDKLAYEITYEFVDKNAADGRTSCKISNEAAKAFEEGKAKITVSGDNFAGFIVTVIYV